MASTASGPVHIASTKRSSSDLAKAASSGTTKARKQSRLSTGTNTSFRSSKAPSLLNGSADGKSIVSGVGIGDLEGQFSIPSPSQSRSSSAQGSYSTSATTFEDGEDAERPGQEAGDSSGTKRNAKQKEAKGNVLVSVRVRPDASGSEGARTDGEWMVDGRRSLITFRGKECYDYCYGKSGRRVNLLRPPPADD